MRIIPIDDLSADGLADYNRLTDVALRRVSEPAGGLYIAESSKVIERALAAGHRPRSVLMLQQWLDPMRSLLEPLDIPVYIGTAELLEQLTGFNLHRGALASMHRPPLPSVADLLVGARRVVVLEDIVDHTNVGAIFRTAAALGADAILVSPRCADPLYRRSVRVSMGAVLQVPWTRLPEWPEGGALLRSAGFELAALALSPGAVTLDEYAKAAPEKLALLFGSEGDGLSAAALAQATTIVTIPMGHGVDSLNVAATNAVVLWALR